MVTLKAVGGILLVAAFVTLQAFRVADQSKPVGPGYADQTTHRTCEALGWPIWIGFAIMCLGLAFL